MCSLDRHEGSTTTSPFFLGHDVGVEIRYVKNALLQFARNRKLLWLPMLHQQQLLYIVSRSHLGAFKDTSTNPGSGQQLVNLQRQSDLSWRNPLASLLEEKNQILTSSAVFEIHNVMPRVALTLERLVARCTQHIGTVMAIPRLKYEKTSLFFESFCQHLSFTSNLSAMKSPVNPTWSRKLRYGTTHHPWCLAKILESNMYEYRYMIYTVHLCCLVACKFEHSIFSQKGLLGSSWSSSCSMPLEHENKHSESFQDTVFIFWGLRRRNLNHLAICWTSYPWGLLEGKWWQVVAIYYIISFKDHFFFHWFVSQAQANIFYVPNQDLLAQLFPNITGGSRGFPRAPQGRGGWPKKRRHVGIFAAGWGGPINGLQRPSRYEKRRTTRCFVKGIKFLEKRTNKTHLKNDGYFRELEVGEINISN